LVDGAHAIGNIEIDMQDIDADFYTSNLHKWLCVPKSCAFLWAKRDKQFLLAPLVVSHGYAAGFHAEFIWMATYDYSAFISVPVCVRIYNAIGYKKIIKRNHEMAWWAVEMLGKKWGTKVISSKENATSLAVVQLPEFFGPKDGPLVYELLQKHHIEVPISTYQGLLYCRISCHLYSKKDDYYRLADVLLQEKKIEVVNGLNSIESK